MHQQSGFDCLGATDTTPSFSDFLKKEGVNVMAATAEQLKGSDAKDATKKKPDDKSKSSSSGSMTYPLVGAGVGVAGGALLWKAHRVWGGVLGLGVGGALGRLASMFF
jgi:hypothetical protein